MERVWKIPGIYHADAERVAQEIGEGEITPEEVVEKARNPESELHKCFEWDDSIAAEKYRITQAAHILRFIVIKPDKKEKPEIRQYSLTKERKVYQPTRAFIKNVDEHTELLRRAMMELEAFKKRYHMLSELEEIFRAIDEL